MYLRFSLAIALVAILLAGCGHKKHARRTPPTPAPSAAPKLGHTETGVASWYGHPYHGRRAANGEIYDMEKLTAAHRTLPFDTWLRVVNLDNSKTVEVRITDRGPFVEGRIIDLSHAAARAIEMIGPGTARVRIEVIRTPKYAPPAAFAVQVGAFLDRANAERLRAEMESRYGSARLIQRADTPDLWRVLAGSEATEEGAIGLAARILSSRGVP
jgi:rare lipoprotein A